MKQTQQQKYRQKLKAHALKRAEQRIGKKFAPDVLLMLNREIRKEMRTQNSQIVNIVLDKKTASRRVYRFLWGGAYYYAVYSNHMKEIVTLYKDRKKYKKSKKVVDE